MAAKRRYGDKPCRFIVGTFGRSFPATARGLLEARVVAKRLSRDDRSGITYAIRLACGAGKGRAVQHTIEECSRSSCRKVK